MHNHFDRHLNLKAWLLGMQPKVIVECGAGHGELTKQLLGLHAQFPFTLHVINDSTLGFNGFKFHQGISYLMLDAHGGHLDLEANAGGRGIVATAWLPESRDKQDFTEFRGKKLIVASTRAERIHKVIVELEQRQGCHVAEAHAEEEILALIREESGWDMLLLDDSMPLALIESRVGSLVPVRALSV